MRSRLLLLTPCLLSGCVAPQAPPPPVQAALQAEEYVLRSAFIRENAEVEFKVKERGFSSLAACDKRRLELDPREIALTCVTGEEANG